MNKEQYLSEVERRLLGYFSASREGYKVPAQERHRLEGFMQGALFMGLASSKELAGLMERAHFVVFAKTIEEKRLESTSLWPDTAINYDGYDQPAYERKHC